MWFKDLQLWRSMIKKGKDREANKNGLLSSIGKHPQFFCLPFLLVSPHREPPPFPSSPLFYPVHFVV